MKKLLITFFLIVSPGILLAQEALKGFKHVYIEPHIGLAWFNYEDNDGYTQSSFKGAALSYGGSLGLMLGPLRLGIIYDEMNRNSAKTSYDLTRRADIKVDNIGLNLGMTGSIFTISVAGYMSRMRWYNFTFPDQARRTEWENIYGDSFIEYNGTGYSALFGFVFAKHFKFFGKYYSMEFDKLKARGGTVGTEEVDIQDPTKANYWVVGFTFEYNPGKK